MVDFFDVGIKRLLFQNPKFIIIFNSTVNTYTILQLCYSLVPNVDIEEVSPTSSQSGSSCAEEVRGPGPVTGILDQHTRASSGEDDEDDDGLRISRINGRGTPGVSWNGNGERRRRKLPEIPKNKKCKLEVVGVHSLQSISIIKI